MTREQLEDAAREADRMSDAHVDATWALVGAVYRIGWMLWPIAVEAERRAFPLRAAADLDFDSWGA